MTPQTPQQDASKSDLCGPTAASLDVPSSGTLQPHRNQLGQCNATNAATGNMTHDAYLTMVGITGGRKTPKQHMIGCGSIHIKEDSPQRTI